MGRKQAGRLRRSVTHLFDATALLSRLFRMWSPCLSRYDRVISLLPDCPIGGFRPSFSLLV